MAGNCIFLLMTLSLRLIAMQSTTESTTEFSCNMYGRFVDTMDLTCQWYYFCYPSGSTYQAVHLKCPTTTVFEPTIEKCVASSDFDCVIASTTTKPTIESTTEITTQPTTVTTTATIEPTTTTTTSTTQTTTTSTAKPTTASTTTSTAKPTTTSTTQSTTSTTTEFGCSAYGRYADTTDSTCQWYYFCYLSGNSYVIQRMKCPTTTVFNPTISKCVAGTSYACIKSFKKLKK